jgi:hypothetical protein
MLSNYFSYKIAKKFFLMGAPGTMRAENANAIKDDLNKLTKKGDEWRVIHTGELLKRTSEKKTELGNKIKACMIANQYGKLFKLHFDTSFSNS